MKYKRYMITMIIVILILNLIAWISPAFCDWYAAYIFQIWVNVFARFMNLFPFSVGEVMIVLGIILIIIAIVLGIGAILLRRNKRFIRGVLKFYKIFGAIFVNVCLVLTLNFSMLYHCSHLDPNKNTEFRVYSLSELEILRNFIVEKCNHYAELMERDTDGDVIYHGDMQAMAKEALHGLAQEYPRLAGYYPDVKYIYFSDIMSQAYIAGVYFSFSLEANCNANMYITNYPTTFCHELSHLHGYSFEDEAEFLSYLACIGSEDVFFQYCGYLEVLGYVDNAYVDSLVITGSQEEWAHYASQTKLSSHVINDFIFLEAQMWEEIEEDAIFSTEQVDEISTKVMDTSLKVNGVEEGVAAYGGVVEYLLQYYDGILY